MRPFAIRVGGGAAATIRPLLLCRPVRQLVSRIAVAASTITTASAPATHRTIATASAAATPNRNSQRTHRIAQPLATQRSGTLFSSSPQSRVAQRLFGAGATPIHQFIRTHKGHHGPTASTAASSGDAADQQKTADQLSTDPNSIGRANGNGSNGSAEPYRAQMEKDCSRITWQGAVVNLLLVVFKGAAGVLGNSAAMIADAAHSLSDLVSDAITWFAVRVASNPADSEHPYGHGKFESMGALGISGILVLTGGAVGWHALMNLELIVLSANTALMASMAAGAAGGAAKASAAAAAASVGPPTSIAAVAAVVSIVVKELLYQATMRVGTKYDSKVVKANAWHHRSDAISSVVALLGILGSLIHLPVLDPVAGLVVSAMIVKTGLSIGMESVNDLLDTAVDKSLRTSIETLMNKFLTENVLVAYHNLRMRRMGPYVMMDVHIVVPSRLSVSAAHQIAERVRLSVLKQFSGVSEVLVHVDAEDTGSMTATDSADSDTPLMRPQADIEADVRKVVSKFPSILGVTHFTCHWLNQKLNIQLEVVMDPQLRIVEAQALASRVQSALKDRIPDVTEADIHLELHSDHIHGSVPLVSKRSGADGEPPAPPAPSAPPADAPKNVLHPSS